MTDTQMSFMVNSDRMMRYLGGVEVAGSQVENLTGGMPLVHLVREGLPVDVIVWARTHLDVPRDVFHRIFPRQTVDSAVQRGGRASSALTERMLRAAKVYALAEEAFGEAERGKAWMAEPNPRFEDMRPIELLDSQQGAEEVEHMLVRMMYGVVA